jgi:hypothetical protein
MDTCYLAEEAWENQGNDGLTNTPEEGTCLEQLIYPAAANYFYNTFNCKCTVAR